MDEMSVWDVLGLEGPGDKRSIKRAYARLLKHNKPDQNPEGFKQLRAAYEHALDLASQAEQAPQSRGFAHTPIAFGDEVPPEAPASVTTEDKDTRIDTGRADGTLPDKVTPSDDGTDSLEPSPSEVKPEEETHPASTAEVTARLEEVAEADIIDTVMSAVVEVLQDQRKVNSLQAWQDALAPANGCDIFVRRELSYTLFACLLDYHKQLKAKDRKYKALNNTQLNYLNDTFHWREDRSLALHFDEDEIIRFIGKPAQDQGFARQSHAAQPTHYEEPNVFIRLLIGGLDLFICSLLGLILANVSESLGTGLGYESGAWTMIVLMASYVIYGTAFEVVWKTTPAGSLAKFVVLHKGNRPAGILGILWRNVLKLVWLLCVLVSKHFAVIIIGFYLSVLFSPVRVYKPQKRD